MAKRKHQTAPPARPVSHLPPPTSASPAGEAQVQAPKGFIPRIAQGLSNLLGGMARTAKTVTFADEVGVTTTGGSSAFGKTTLEITGDPEAIAQFQAQIEASRAAAAQAQADAHAAAAQAQADAQQGRH